MRNKAISRFLNWTFSQKFVVDDRDPLVWLRLHQGWEIQIFLPSIGFTLQVIWIFCLQIMIGCILSTILYFWVLPQRDKKIEQKIQSQRLLSTMTTSTKGFLFGFGFIIPIALLIPYFAIVSFDIRNLGFRLAWVSLPMTMILRTLETMFGFVPYQHCQSLWSFVRHNGFVLQPIYKPKDGNTIPFTASSFVVILKNYVFWLSCLAVTYHFFTSSNFFPFTQTAGTTFNPERIFYWDWPHLYDTFLQAYLMNVSLSLSMTGVSSLGGLLTGVQMDDRVTHHPMLLSESVSEFWGRRWNNLIHVGLKQGVYKPVRAATHSKFMASIAAFVVSGICHEYVWTILYVPSSAQIEDGNGTMSCCPSCYCQSWVGKQLIFFGWNGILIALEYLLGKNVLRYTRWLPRLMRCHLVVLLSLPVGHLFTYDITQAGYFSHLQSAIPMLVATRMKI